MKKIRLLMAVLGAFSFVACSGTGSVASSAAPSVLKGTADCFGGTITAEVTVDGDGKITDLALTGDDETPNVGGAALGKLQEAIISAGTIEDVDGLSGATYTSKGVFNAFRDALGTSTPEPTASFAVLSASGLKQGLAVVSTPHLGRMTRMFRFTASMRSLPMLSAMKMIGSSIWKSIFLN